MHAKRRGERARIRNDSVQPTAIDLFAGAGGASQGLRDAGFRVLAAVETDESAADTYAQNHKGTKLLRQDIKEVDTAQLRKELMLAPHELTLLNACPPCQGFSTLGAADADDPRNDLIAAVWPFVAVMRPRAIVLENVPGIRDDDRLVRLLRQARGAGYSAREYCVQAADLGVPQRRRRHLIVAISNARKTLPADFLDFLPDDVPVARSTVGPVFEASAQIDPRADPLHVGRTLRKQTKERVRAVPIGGTRFDLPKSKQLACHKRLGQRNATGPYGRMKADQPAPTLTTRCTTPSCGSFIHPTEDRGITLREAALIQTFPLTYSFCGGYGSMERQIGNALPPRVAELLAVAVLAAL